MSIFIILLAVAVFVLMRKVWLLELEYLDLRNKSEQMMAELAMRQIDRQAVEAMSLYVAKLPRP